MKHSIIAIICVSLLVGCGRHEAQKQTPVISLLTNGQSPIVKIAFPEDQSLTNTGSHSKQPLLFSFKRGSDRDAVFRELDRIHATVVTNTPELVLAKVQSPVRMTQLEFRFADGKLKTTIFTP
jgi:hypothetical protein